MAEVQPDICVYRLMEPAEWEAFEREGRFAGSAHDRADGFIHFSRANQVVATAQAHYGGHAALVLVEVATAPVLDFMRWEESRGAELFPHLYGVLDRDAVRRHWRLERGVDWAGAAWPQGVS